MKKLLVVLIIIAALVGLYLVTDIVMDLRLRSETRAMKAAGHATTIAEVRPHTTSESREAARLVLTAYDSVLANSDAASRNKREFNNIALADDSLGYADNPALFQEVLARYSSSLALMLKAAEYPEITFPFEYEKGWAMSLENIPLSVQTGCRLMRIYAKACFAQGRTEEGIKTLRATIHLANGIKDNFGIMLLVRNLQLRGAFTLIRKFAPQLKPEALSALQSEVEATNIRSSFKPMLEAEMGLTQQALITHLGWPQSDMEPRSPFRDSVLALSPVRKLARWLDMASTRRQIGYAAQPWYRSKALWDRDSVEYGKAGISGSLARAFAINARFFFVRAERDRAETEVTQLGLKVLRYRAEHGRLPENLEAVGGHTLLDPFSGQPYIYRPGANGFLLYSLGGNMKDDGGERPKDVGWQATL